MTKEEYNALTDKLIKYSNSYYNDDTSLITDREFDELLVQSQYAEKKHPEWIREDSITQKPGISVNGDKFKHDHGMLSLGNTYNQEELKKWYDDMKTFGANEFVVEYKYDGVSFSAKYKDGSLSKGVSRGDGEYGLDMTLNMRMIDDLQLLDATGSGQKPFTGEVRGEIMMSKAEFERLNALEEDHKHANPRNLTSGTLKLLDLERIKERKLIAFAYWLEGNTSLHSLGLEAMRIMGFNVGKYFLVKTFEELWAAIEQIEKEKNTLDYEIDGAVIKVNDTKLWQTIGFTSKFPKWAKAYKYEPESVVTRVNDITFQVGRTGKITPVAELEPVFLSGSTVSRATLNNKAYMEDMDIMIGDYVDVKKAAEIIPFIKEVLVERRDIDEETRTAITFPTICPDCGTKLVKYNDEHQDYYCTNENCRSRIVGKLVKYTTDMEIDGFAEVLVGRLNSEGFLSSILDLYHLKDHYAEIVKLDRLGEKTVKRLLQNIEDSKTQKLEKYITALGIKNVGTNTGKILTKKFKSLKVIMGATKDEFQEIDDIGEIVSESLFEYFKKPENKKFLKDMEDLGMNPTGPVVVEEADKPKISLLDKNFCITGALSLKRETYIDLIENCGGKVVSGVTKKTNYLITNDKTTGTSKNQKAEELGIPLLNETELLEMCDSLHLLKEMI